MKAAIASTGILLTVILFVWSLGYFVRVYEDAYCRNTPWDRLDYERCGIINE